MSSSQGRQYEGFSYPGSGADGVAPASAYTYGYAGTAAGPLGSGVGATSGLIRRTTSATAGGGGYNYFHQHTNSAGGHSAFGSESGSVTSSRAAAAAAAAAPSSGAALVSVNSGGGGPGTGNGFRAPASGSSQGSQRAPFVQSTPTTTMQFVDFNAAAPPAAVGVSAGNYRPAGPFYPPSQGTSTGPSYYDSNAPASSGAGGYGHQPAPPGTNNLPRQPFAQPPPDATRAPYAPPNPAKVSGGGAGGPPSGSRGNGFLGRLFGSVLNDADDVYGPTPGAGDVPRPLHQTRFGFPDDDLPLLDELGINPKSIVREARVVLNPFASAKVDPKDATDLAGPLVFVIALAFLLSLHKKEMQFSAIYGLCVVGLLFFKILLSLMSATGVSIIFVMSALGYSLLPNLLLALLRTAVTSPSVTLTCAIVVAVWSSWCATALLVKGLDMPKQRYLILYPLFLFYAVFATLTVF